MTNSFRLFRLFLFVIAFSCFACTKSEVEPTPPNPLPSLEEVIKLSINGESCIDTMFTINCDKSRGYYSSNGYGGGQSSSRYYIRIRQELYQVSHCFSSALTISAIWTGPVNPSGVSYNFEQVVELNQASALHDFFVDVSILDTNDYYRTTVYQDPATFEFSPLDSAEINTITYSLVDAFCPDSEATSLFLNGVYKGSLLTPYQGLQDSMSIEFELNSFDMGNYY